jgi:hypothetical protein
MPKFLALINTDGVALFKFIVLLPVFLLSLSFIVLA